MTKVWIKAITDDEDTVILINSILTHITKDNNTITNKIHLVLISDSVYYIYLTI